MNNGLFKRLHAEGQLDDPELQRIEEKNAAPLVSVHWDLRTMLYLGILLLSSGMGIFIYKHINAIGHMVIVAAIGVLCTACFVYCFRLRVPYSNDKVESPNLWFDYVLLLGCLLMVTFVGYLQYQYHAFGTEWGLATFLPMLALFFCAYYFDHKGILSMAITSLAAWMGIAVQPERLIDYDQFGNDTVLWSAMALGLMLHLFSYLSTYRGVKAHFAFSYKNFGIHILLVALLAAMFKADGAYYLLWFLGLAAVCAFHFWEAIKQSAFYFFMVATLYGYIGISTVLVRALFSGNGSEGVTYLLFMYFIASAIGVIMLLIRYNKKLKQHDGL